MTELEITIDARNLFDRLIIVEGMLPDGKHLIEKPIDKEPQTFKLLSETPYRLAVRSGGTSEIEFKVTEEGLVTYNDVFEGIVTGKKTKTLTVIGHRVAIDARYLALDGALGVLLGAGGLTKEDWIVHRSDVFLLPAAGYRCQQGSAMVSTFQFTLTREGTFFYDDKYDFGAGGFLEGRGTSTLVFRGYPFLIDGTQVAESFGVSVKGLATARNSVQFVNLLPMNVPYRIGIGVAAETLGVTVNDNGSVVPLNGPTIEVVRDTYRGIPRLKLVKK